MNTPVENIHKILIVVIAHMGDVILATPLTRALKRRFPGAEIDLLISPIAKEAAMHNPYVDHQIIYDLDNLQSSALRPLIQELQNKTYDLALSLNDDLIGAMLTGLSCARYRLGFENKLQPNLFTHTVKPPTKLLHQSEKYLEILKPLGRIEQDSSIEFKVFESERVHLYHKLDLSSTKPLIVLCPFSSHKHKNWTSENWIAIINYLSKKAQCILIGSEKELPEIEKIHAATGNAGIIAAGKLTLGESAALIKAANLFITVDTGPMHIAQAFDTPVIVLMGPTHSRVWGPRNRYDIVLRSLRCPCAPCWQLYKNYCNFECKDHSCMTQITADEVIKAANYVLNMQRKIWA
ncbi:glycosyltransferase family 9 protein [Anaerosinus massiliensis]|uniref:glycosyltransferase family 9 protein n=1 Tax=Massilibacillus massiliensis TaxID=1806837 RepID=UPI000DA63FAF|nr:glycosyltransferase family 9 protein [Massilibacillus massiliensis]